MMKTSELLPCPLCNSTNLLLRDIAGWELDCLGCELSLVLADDPSREGLIARWNQRAESRKLPSEFCERWSLPQEAESELSAIFGVVSLPTSAARAAAEAATHEIVHLLDRTTPLSIGGSLVKDIEAIILTHCAGPDAGEAMRWQPIATAPKDGTRILVGHDDNVWLDEWWKGSGTDSNWSSLVGWEHATGRIALRPTHWMPLPAPPTVGKQEDEG